MEYYLYFALNLRREDNNVVYDKEAFADEPIRLSNPEINNMIACFIKNFDQVAIVEDKTTDTTKKVGLEKEEQLNQPDHDDNQSKVLITNFLKPVSGEAFICSKENIDQDYLNELYQSIKKYMERAISQISKENDFLSLNLNPIFSSLKEIVDLRNYLQRFVISDNKIYRKGFLYITKT
jgi:hypothetical protein